MLFVLAKLHMFKHIKKCNHIYTYITHYKHLDKKIIIISSTLPIKPRFFYSPDFNPVLQNKEF